jgi:hypothetical protein
MPPVRKGHAGASVRQGGASFLHLDQARQGRCAHRLPRPGLGLRSEGAPSRRGATARLAPRARGFNSPQGELAVCEHGGTARWSSGSCIIVQGVSDGGPSDARDGVRPQR